MSTTIKQAIDGFLLSCKVEGKSYGTIECYSDKLKGFLWYATNYNWPDDISEITTQHLRELLEILDSKLIVLGIAIGYPDTEAPVNTFERTREPLGTFTHWHGL